MAGKVEDVMRNFSKAFKSKVSEEQRAHLKNVYGCLTLGMGAATAGAYLQLTTSLFQSSFMIIMSSLAAFVCLLYVLTNKGDGPNNHRIGAFLGFTLCSGIGLGPLLEIAIILNPSIIITALMLTTLLFVSFTFAAIFAKDGQWVYIGGSLMTLLSSIMMLSLANIFFGSKLLFDATLYLGLIAMCGFILYDTQLILEKCKRGEKDFISHSIDLFIDFVGVFRRILIILQDREVKQQKNKKDE